jgi:heme exporter protein C
MESLHPGAEGNPAFSDITHPVMRLVFYPAVIGFIGLFWVLYTQRVRLAQMVLRYNEMEEADL